ncbi:MAG: tyrosine-type recombinase/integrase [Candidatus Dormiibacterota bacterium]
MPKLSVVGAPIPSAIATLANDFLADCRARGLSIRSVEHYHNSVVWHFLPWCAREGITDPSQLTPQLAGRFTTDLMDNGGKQGKPLARASVRTYVQATRVFLGWCADPEGGAVGVGAKPRLPKSDKRLFDVLSRSELQSMEDAAPTERDKLILRILADTGIRLGEVLGLKAEDVREVRKGEYGLMIHGKGSKDRLVPLAPATYRRLRRYLSGRHAEPGDAMFVSLRKGAGGLYAPLTESGVEQAVRIMAKEAGIERRVYPHLLRHSFATEWLRKGGNVISLQRILGHADLSMITSVYVHLDTSDDYQAAMTVLLGKD